MANFNKDVRIFDEDTWQYTVVNWHDSMVMPKYRTLDRSYDDAFEYTTELLNNNSLPPLDTINIFDTTVGLGIPDYIEQEYLDSQENGLRTINLHKNYEIPYIYKYASINTLDTPKFEGITKVNGVETACKVYLFDADMNEISKTISDDSGFYSFDHVKVDDSYHIVCIPFTTECPQISKSINPMVV